MKYIQFSTNQLVLLIIALIPLVGTHYISNKVQFILYIDIFLRSFSLLFAIIPQVIIYYRTKSVKRDVQSTIIKQELMNCFEKVTESKELSRIKLILFFIIIGILRFFSFLLFSFINTLQVFGFGNTINFLCLLVALGGCFFILQFKLSMHHFLGLTIVLIAAIMEVALIYEFFIKAANSFQISLGVCITLLFLYILLAPFKEVIEKHLITNYFFSSNTLLIFEGAFSLIITIILIIITQKISCDNSIFFVVCKENQWEEIKKYLAELFNFKDAFTLYPIFSIILTFFGSLLLMEINKRLTPLHKYITDNVASLIYRIISICQRLILGGSWDEIKTMLLYILLSLISTIGCFLFNEYIILKCCHLHTDTQKEIRRRAIEENNEYELNITNIMSLSNSALFKE